MVKMGVSAGFATKIRRAPNKLFLLQIVIYIFIVNILISKPGLSLNMLRRTCWYSLEQRSINWQR